MANYYTKASFLLELPEAALKDFEAIFEEDDDHPVVVDFLEKSSFEDVDDFKYGVQASREGDSALWCHHDESMNVDAAVEAIHYVLKKHKLDDIVSFEWSNDCSKDRLDAFGGGCAVITRKKIWSSTTYQSLAQHRDRLIKAAEHKKLKAQAKRFQG